LFNFLDLVFVTSSKEVMFLPLCVCLSICQQDNSKKLLTKFDEIIWRDVMCDPQQLIRLWWWCWSCCRDRHFKGIFTIAE